MSAQDIKILFSTEETRFAGTVYCAEETWAACHLTTYGGSIPTDHGILLREGDRYRIVITDGMGHWEPKAIGAVAAAVLKETYPKSIAAFSKAEQYRNYVKKLAIKYKNGEGTTLLQVEFFKKKKGKLSLILGKCGDSDLVIIDEKGKVLFGTVDATHHKTKEGKEVGLLAIGGNFSEKWLDHATYLKTTVKTRKAFVIAASDGLTTCLRNDDGSIDNNRLRYAVLTGKALSKGDAIPSFPEISLTPKMIIDHLQTAAHSFARKEAEKTQRAAGDDTTIIATLVST